MKNSTPDDESTGTSPEQTANFMQVVPNSFVLCDNPDAIPPQKWQLNSYGLLNHIKYHFNPDGSIDWRKMINPKFIALNKGKAAKIEVVYGKSLAELQSLIQTKQIDESTIDDQYKVILLAGFKELAQIRGYQKVTHQVEVATSELVVVNTTICWRGNYETDMVPVCFSALADAHYGNTDRFFRNFLSTLAENRGFVRAVRNFLKINIVGSDEVSEGAGENPNEELIPVDGSPFTPIDPRFKIWELLKSNNVSFASFKKGMIGRNFVDANEWNDWGDIKKSDAFELITKVKEGLEEKKNKK